MDTVWIGAHDVLRLLNAGTAAVAERWAETIIDRVGRGLIGTRAQSLFISGIAQEGTPAPIPPGVWRAYNLEQNWVTGDFKAKANPFASKPIWFEAFGVEFERHKIEALVPSGGILSFPPPEQPVQEGEVDATISPVVPPSNFNVPARSRPGRKPNQDDWKRFAAAFAVVASKEDIDPGVSAAAIYKQIADYANNEQDSEIMSEETVRDAITLAQAWKGGIRVK